MAGLVVKETPKTTKAATSPMSFSDALTTTKAVAEAETARKEGSPRAQTTPASQPRKTEGDAEMMRPKRYCCIYPGRSTLRTTVVVWRVGQVLVPSIRPMLLVWRRMCS